MPRRQDPPPPGSSIVNLAMPPGITVGDGSATVSVGAPMSLAQQIAMYRAQADSLERERGDRMAFAFVVLREQVAWSNADKADGGPVLFTPRDDLAPQIADSREDVPWDEDIQVIPVWTLGDRLRKAREMTGLDIRKFAEKIDASPNSISSWERDLTHPRDLIPTLQRWSEHTKVSLHWLLTGNDAALPE